MSNINEIKDTAMSALDSAFRITENMKDGEKIRIPDLAEQVGAEVGMDGDDILPFITFMVRRLDGLVTARGRNGGVYKGSKPVAAPKVQKKSSKDDKKTAKPTNDSPIDITTTASAFNVTDSSGVSNSDSIESIDDESPEEKEVTA